MATQKYDGATPVITKYQSKFFPGVSASTESECEDKAKAALKAQKEPKALIDGLYGCYASEGSCGPGYKFIPGSNIMSATCGCIDFSVCGKARPTPGAPAAPAAPAAKGKGTFIARNYVPGGCDCSDPFQSSSANWYDSLFNQSD